jgi:hypothetical protein
MRISASMSKALSSRFCSEMSTMAYISGAVISTMPQVWPVVSVRGSTSPVRRAARRPVRLGISTLLFAVVRRRTRERAGVISVTSLMMSATNSAGAR